MAASRKWKRENGSRSSRAKISLRRTTSTATSASSPAIETLAISPPFCARVFAVFHRL
jgi:hypothetical protein